ncbi:CN hydrolase domain-containing protein [Candidatus Magnetomoraceae bacterium gMMP-15]
MKSLLDSINDLRGITCPYKFFITLYHIALPHEKALIDLSNSMKNNFEKQLFNLPFDRGSEIFCIEKILSEFMSEITNELKAGLFITVLLCKMDNYLAGLEKDFMPDHVIDRLINPNYYQSIKVDIDEAFYVITPRIEPFYKQCITDKIDRPEHYFVPNLTAYFLEHHTIIKDEKVNNYNINFANGFDDPTIVQYFNQSFLNLSTLSIGLAPFDQTFSMKPVIYKKNKNKVRFRFSSIASPPKEDVKKIIETILKQSFENNVDILLFPELAIDHDAYTVISEWLSLHNSPDKIKMVIPGSFHKERDKGGYVNQASMLDWNGNIVWKHCKQSPFVLTDYNIESSVNKEKIREIFNLDPGDNLEENIHADYPLTFIDTPIGRMSTLICLDFLLASVSEIISRLPCDYFWVPAMTTNIRDFETMARDIYGKKHHVVSACCASQSCCEFFCGQPMSLSFLYAPSKKCAKKMATPDDPCPDLPLLIYRLDKLF